MLIMAHYARVNSDNIVTFVTPIPNEMITDENGVEHEEWAFDHLYATIPDSIEDKWIKTSYNSQFRKTYAGIGYIWNEKLDAFIPPKPFDSWNLNEETCDWEPPVPKPEYVDGGPTYYWNESIKSWIPNYEEMK